MKPPLKRPIVTVLGVVELLRWRKGNEEEDCGVEQTSDGSKEYRCDEGSSDGWCDKLASTYKIAHAVRLALR
jgi:hypothetical protein